MLESNFLEDWDEIGTKMAKKGHLLPKSGINSELVSIQRVKKSCNAEEDHRLSNQICFSHVLWRADVNI